MIANIRRGWKVGGLIRYLMGPGECDEHVDPRVIAAWDDAPELHQPAPAPGSWCGFDVSDLVSDLTTPAAAFGVSLQPPQPPQPLGAGAQREARRGPQGPVWHCSLRNAPDDPVLSDAQWTEVITDLLDRTGIARRDDPGGCRWVAIRHAPDHVHVAAVLVRQDDGCRAHPWRDYVRAREVCRAAEDRLGLTPTGTADRTAAPAPSRLERDRATRAGEAEPARVRLHRAARTAAVAAHDPDGFFRTLAGQGVHVRPRHDTTGVLVGYAVAAPGDTTTTGRPVWFGGRRLAPDLSLPALHARWASAPTPSAAAAGHAPLDHDDPHGALEQALGAVEAATTALRRPCPSAAARDAVASAVAHAAGDLMTALCAATASDPHPSNRDDFGAGASAGVVGGGAVPWAVSDSFDRAARTPYLVVPRRWPPVAAALHTAAGRLAGLRATGRPGDRDDTGMAELVVALAALAAEVAAYHETRRHLAQAAAARRSSTALRATRPTDTRPPTAPASRGPGRPTAPSTPSPQAAVAAALAAARTLRPPPGSRASGPTVTGRPGPVPPPVGQPSGPRRRAGPHR